MTAFGLRRRLIPEGRYDSLHSPRSLLHVKEWQAVKIQTAGRAASLAPPAECSADRRSRQGGSMRRQIRMNSRTRI